MANKTEHAERTEHPELALAGPGSPWRSRVVNRSLARATKRSLERAALNLMDEKGTTNFTVQEACDGAGQSLRTFYMHFSGKDDLLLAVYEELYAAFVERITAEVEAIDDPLQRIAMSITAAIAQTVAGDSKRMQRDRALAHFRHTLTEGHAVDVAAVQVPYINLVIRLIDEAVASGDLPPQDAGKMSFIISALKTAYLHSVLLGNDVGLDTPDPGELATFCLRGLGADPSRI